MENQIITRKEAIEKSEKYYFTGKPCKHGHIEKRKVIGGGCIVCLKNRDSNRYEQKKEYRSKNEYKIREYHKKWYMENKERILNNQKEYVKNNKDKFINYQKKYKKENRNKINNYFKNRLKSDINFKLIKNTRSLIRNSFNNITLSKDSKTVQILGCTFEEFKIHIEKQFKDGMSWENRSEWHIDHIIPISSAKTEKEIIELNHFTNLRPLWAKENLQKGAKREYLI